MIKLPVKAPFASVTKREFAPMVASGFNKPAVAVVVMAYVSTKPSTDT